MGQENQPRLIRVDTLDRVVYPIAEGTTRIGRSRGLQICLEDRAVSRFHCYLQREGDTVRIFDGESKNPARLDGEPVNGQTLRTGHSIRIGHCELVYEGPLPATEEKEKDKDKEEEKGTQPAAELGARAAPPRRAASFTPRRPPVRRGSRASVGWIVAALALFPLLVWLVVSYLPRAVETRTASTDAGQAAAARLRRLEEELGRLRDELTGKLAQPGADRAAAEHAAALTQRIRELETELSRQRDEAPAAGGAGLLDRGDAVAAASGEVSVPDEDLEFAEEVASLEDLRPGGGGTTVVVKDPSPRVQRSPWQIRELVTKLTTRLDDYATHLVTPKKLEPELSELSLSLGKAAAEGMLDVHDHARQLLRVTDASIADNDSRRRAMLRKAAATAPPEGAGKKPEEPKKPGAYDPPVGPQAETEQRLLEMFARAVSIHRQHRTFLVALSLAIQSAMRRLTDAEAVQRLRARFADETGDPELCAAIAAALQDAGLRESIPALYKKLGVASDPALKAAIHEALVALAGKDLGDAAPAWAQWWTEEGSR